MNEEIVAMIVNYLPVVLAILSEVGVVAGVIIKIREATNQIFKKTDEIVESNDFTDLKDQLANAHRENMKLKEQIDKLIASLNKVNESEE